MTKITPDQVARLQAALDSWPSDSIYVMTMEDLIDFATPLPEDLSPLPARPLTDELLEAIELCQNLGLSGDYRLARYLIDHGPGLWTGKQLIPLPEEATP